MNKSVILKNKIILYFSFLLTFFLSIYLIYFLSKTLHNLQIENNHYSDRVKRLQPNTIDLDFLDENVRKNLGFIDKDERVIILNK